MVQMYFEGYYDFYNGKLNATLYSFKVIIFPFQGLGDSLCVLEYFNSCWCINKLKPQKLQAIMLSKKKLQPINKSSKGL